MPIYPQDCIVDVHFISCRLAYKDFLGISGIVFTHFKPSLYYKLK